MDIVERANLFEGAEIQIVVGGTTFCAYRKKTAENKIVFYIAPEKKMQGPSGRKNVSRLSWNMKPENAKSKRSRNFLSASSF